MAIEIVDLPIENGAFPWLCGCLPEGSGIMSRCNLQNETSNWQAFPTICFLICLLDSSASMVPMKSWFSFLVWQLHMASQRLSISQSYSWAWLGMHWGKSDTDTAEFSHRGFKWHGLAWVSHDFIHRHSEHKAYLDTQGCFYQLAPRVLPRPWPISFPWPKAHPVCGCEARWMGRFTC